MKVLFVGPSLFGVECDLQGLVVRGPAEMGDIEKAIQDGARAIGIIDGHYQQVGAVWHKEILHALAAGVVVLGGASMGALRAAECRSFGMQPVGEIALRYCRGALFDDADVAVTNAPAEFGFMPLSEPLVDAEATLILLFKRGLITQNEFAKLRRLAREIFFADRTDETIVDAAKLGARGHEILRHYRRHHVSLKRRDALRVVRRLRAVDADIMTVRSDFVLSKSAFWQQRPGRHRLLA